MRRTGLTNASEKALSNDLLWGTSSRGFACCGGLFVSTLLNKLPGGRVSVSGCFCL